MRSHVYARQLVLPALFVLATLAHPLAAGPTYTVGWAPPQNATRSAIKSFFPTSAVDSHGKIHIVYETEDQTLWYTNNVAGSFAPPQAIQRNLGQDLFPFFSLAVGPNNTLHLVYCWFSGDQQIYYRQATLNGATVAWSAPQRISTSGEKSVDPTVVVDAAGNAHIGWNEHCPGVLIYSVFYRLRRADGTLEDPAPLRRDCNVQQRNLKLALTADGKLHAVFSDGDEILYARREGNAWLTASISESPGVGSKNPALTTDGTALYASWSEGVNIWDVLFRRSVDGGQSWSNIIPLANTPDLDRYPTMAYAPQVRRVYVAWISGPSTYETDVWYREFDPASGITSPARRLAQLPGQALIPTLAVGQSIAAISWQDKTSGTWQVYSQSGAISCAGGPAGQSRAEPTLRSTSSLTHTLYVPFAAFNAGGCL